MDFIDFTATGLSCLTALLFSLNDSTIICGVFKWSIRNCLLWKRSALFWLARVYAWMPRSLSGFRLSFLLGDTPSEIAARLCVGSLSSFPERVNSLRDGG